MIRIIYGERGTGKTQLIIDEANQTLKKATGKIVFVTDNTRCMYELKRDITFVNVQEYNIFGEKSFTSFIKGIVSGNSALEYLFIDGVARICEVPLNDLENFFKQVDDLSNKHNVMVVMTCSCERTNLPAFIWNYVNSK